jgi:hypothetical protein
MGKGVDSDDEDDSRPRSATAPAPKGGAGPGSTEWKEDEWKDKTREIWARDISQLPVHTDIPRLGARMKVYDSEGKLSMEEIPDTVSRGELVQRLLIAISGSLDDHDSVSALKEKYFSYIEESGKGDISQQLLRFLVESLSSEGLTIKILKACHQKIVFPGFYHVKSRLFSHLPFKDMRGTWSMSIHLLENHFEVRHRKAQVSQPPKGSPPDDLGDEFNFEWELRMDFDLTMSQMLEVDVRVVTINYRDDVSQDRRTQIENTIRQHFPE